MDKAALSTLAKPWKEGAWEIQGVVLEPACSRAKLKRMLDEETEKATYEWRQVYDSMTTRLTCFRVVLV